MMRQDLSTFYRFSDESVRKYIKVNTCECLCKYLSDIYYCELQLYPDPRRNDHIIQLVLELQDELRAYLKSEAISVYDSVIRYDRRYKQLTAESLFARRSNHA